MLKTKRIYYVQGFNLLEVLITISIVGILASVALPSFLESIKSTNMSNLANDMHRSIVVARSEAIKRGVNVTVCTSNPDKTDCSNAGSWEGGWIVREVTAVADFDPVISIYAPFDSNYSLHGTTTAYKSNVVFSAAGEAIASGDMVLCYKNEVDAQTRTIVINRFGKVSVRGIDRKPQTSCY
ncbi:GspH/FimT family pseudopilin [Colwellia piezophila]|uniref:GspH/FimT family pseudopilin n=1 Tax=Colwellia piezophila TaxID=211668 RepID=UPI00037695D6|nr:GspH/FimT family pseudopilin [Colwellia piezophila]